MSIQITSTTDTNEDVLAAIGGLSQKSKGEEKSVSSEAAKVAKQDETTEESDTSENADAEGSDESGSTDDENLKDESKDDQKPKKKGGFQKRIEKFQKKLSEKDQEIEHWKRQALEQKAQDLKKPETANAKVSSIEGKPKAESFETHEEYVDALTDWKLEQREIEKQAKSREENLKTEYQKQVSTFQSKLADFAETKEDFHDVIEDVDDIPLSFGIQEVILSSDLGPQVMYELAKNRNELVRINRLGAVDAAREIGRIEARLSSEYASAKETKEIKQTKAPPPINPVGSKGSAKIEKSPDDMEYQEYKKWRASKK